MIKCTMTTARWAEELEFVKKEIFDGFRSPLGTVTDSIPVYVAVASIQVLHYSVIRLYPGHQ